MRTLPKALLRLWIGSTLLISSLLSGFVRAEPAPSSLVPLLNSMQQRLALAEQVALYKWDTGKPVEDRPREQQVIAQAVTQGREHGLSDASVSAFFTAQIEASKTLQHALLERWKRQGKAPDSKRMGLAEEIRPALDKLQGQLLQRLADFAPYRANPQCPAWVASANLAFAKSSLNHQGTALEPIPKLALSRAAATLCDVPVQSRVLLKSSASWNGITYRPYPASPPELSVVHISIPAHTDLAWHTHPMPNAAYILSGELLVEAAEGGKTLRLHKGEALAEMVGISHRGRTGDKPVELIVFYAGTEGMPLSE